MATRVSYPREICFNNVGEFASTDRSTNHQPVTMSPHFLFSLIIYILFAIHRVFGRVTSLSCRPWELWAASPEVIGRYSSSVFPLIKGFKRLYFCQSRNKVKMMLNNHKNNFSLSKLKSVHVRETVLCRLMKNSDN